MTRNFLKYSSLALCLVAAVGCNDELYPAIDNALFFSEAAPGNSFNQQMETVAIDDGGAVKTLTARLVRPVDEDIKVSFVVDESILEQYNARTGKNYLLLPENLRELDADEVLIPKGSSASQGVQLKIKSYSASNGEEYAIPVRMNKISGPVDIKGSADNMLYFLFMPNIQSAPIVKSGFSGSVSFPKTPMPQWTFEFWIKVNNITGYDVSKGWEGQGKQNDPHISARRGIFKDGASPFEFKPGADAFFCRWWADGIKGIMPTFQIEPGFGNMDSQEWWYPDTWYHLAYTYDGATLTLYKNGEVDVTKGGEKAFAFDTFTFGTNLNGMNVEFAQMRLWSKCLTPANIKDGMAKQIPGDAEGLFAYWQLNEGQGNVLHDSTGHGHDITMTGTPAWSTDRYNFSSPNKKQ